MKEVYKDKHITIQKRVSDPPLECKFEVYSSEVSEEKGGFLHIMTVEFHPDVEDEIFRFLTINPWALRDLKTAMKEAGYN